VKDRPIPSHKDLRDSMPRLRRGSELLQREERDAGDEEVFLKGLPECQSSLEMSSGSTR